MRIADIGTGSGAIALALASEATESVELVIATDVSRDALDIAMLNSSMLPALAARKIEFRCGDMFSVIPECNLDAVVCNPPYIAFDEAVDLPASVRNWEPPTALFSAQQGMLETARLISGSAAALGMGGLLAIEVDSRRASLVAELVLSHASFRDVRVEPDLTGRERFVLAKREK
jgi:release factor glutamine methyltransferase